MKANLLILLLLVVLTFACGGNKSENSNQTPPVVNNALTINFDKPLPRGVNLNLQVDLPKFPVDNIYHTPKGVLVGTVNKIPIESEMFVLSKVDEGMDQLFKSSSHLSFQNATQYSDYAVLMLPPTYFTEKGKCPALRLKDGVTVGGLVLGVGQPQYFPVPISTVAESFNVSDECNQYLVNVVRYEGEHSLICRNLSNMFNETDSLCAHYQGAFDEHPIFPDVQLDNLLMKKGVLQKVKID